MAQIGSLTVDLIAQTASFNANIAKAAQRLNSDAARMAKSLQQIEAAAKATSTGIQALAAAFVVTEGIRIGSAALDYASSLGEVSQQLGVTVEDLQVYRYAATQVGISQEDMEKGLGKLTQTLGKAQEGSASAIAVFDALGVKIRDSSGHALSASDIIPRLADAIAKIPEPSKRAAVEVALFGRAGQKLDTLLSGGSAAIGDMAKQASDLGIVLDSNLVPSADAAADKIAELKLRLEANISRAVAENAGAILDLANALASLTTQTISFIAKYPRLSGALAGLAAGARVGGLPGAAVGAAAGAIGGQKMAQANEDASNDIALRLKKLNEAKAAYDRINATSAASVLAQSTFAGQPISRSALLALAEAEAKKQAALARRAAAEAMRGIAAPAPAPAATNDNPLLDSLFKTGGGGGGGKKSSGPSQAEREAQRLTEQYQKFVEQTQHQFDIEQLRNQGYSYQADLLEGLYDIQERFTGLDKTRLDSAWDLQHALIAQKQVHEETMALLENGMQPLQLTDKQAAEVAAGWQSMLKDLGIETAKKTDEMSQSFAEMANNIDNALSSLASGIRNGGVLDILGGVINLATQLGSAGVFGKSIQAGLNSKKYNTGGFTGWMGVGEVAGVVHGREYVFDAQSTARIGVQNLEAMRKGYRSGGYVGSVGAYLARPGGRAGAYFDLRGAVMTEDLLRQMNQIGVTSATAGAQVGSADAVRTISSRRRKTIP